jgi:hypothetical protein
MNFENIILASTTIAKTTDGDGTVEIVVGIALIILYIRVLCGWDISVDSNVNGYLQSTNESLKGINENLEGIRNELQRFNDNKETQRW